MPELPPPFPGWHLAQVNIGRMVAPLDSPVTAGFVWRFQSEAGNAG